MNLLHVMGMLESLRVSIGSRTVRARMEDATLTITAEWDDGWRYDHSWTEEQLKSYVDPTIAILVFKERCRIKPSVSFTKQINISYTGPSRARLSCSCGWGHDARATQQVRIEDLAKDLADDHMNTGCSIEGLPK